MAALLRFLPSRQTVWAPSALRVLEKRKNRVHRRMMSSSSDHPVVDCSVFFGSGSEPEKKDVLAQMKDALVVKGYFYAENVSVLPPEYIESVYAYHKKLHDLPTQVKSEYLVQKGGSYTGLDLGMDNAELPYEPGTVATVRAWDYSRWTPSENAKRLFYPGPEVLQPEMATFTDNLYDRQNVLGEALLTAFAEMFGLEPDAFRGHFKGDMGSIRLLYYPGCTAEEAAEANTGISAHTDFEAFTLMHQDAPGLQFLSPGGDTWIDAPVRPGEFVVIVGDVLERFTNGELKATPHRVVRTEHPRRSIIRFNAVNPNTLVEPMPQFVSDQRPPRYTPVRMKTHMETTMANLRAGKGAWDTQKNRSITANYVYSSP
uniref:Fe2OG dioxygenase domain-containing protein n=1 Tax=Lotharella globosa TaxID=91324 RepID=A0A7S3ZF50_9EUKA